MSETEARKKFKDVDIYRSEFRPLKATVSGNGGRTLMKLVVEQESKVVVGCHMVGEDAAEIIQGMAGVMSITGDEGGGRACGVRL